MTSSKEQNETNKSQSYRFILLSLQDQIVQIIFLMSQRVGEFSFVIKFIIYFFCGGINDNFDRYGFFLSKISILFMS